MKSITIKELKEKKQWVCWSYDDKDGRIAKIPKNPHNGYNAKVNNADTWGTYEECVTAKEQYHFSGIGIILTNGICGIDVDAVNHNTDDAYQNPLENYICSLLSDTYIERSPSGKGAHILFQCNYEKLKCIVKGEGTLQLDSQYCLKNEYQNIEVYFSDITNRFFTFTEDRLNDKDIIDKTGSIDCIMDVYMKKSNINKEDKANMEIKRILENARNDAIHGAKFIKLYDEGDISDYNNDDSSADLALCDILAEVCNNDREMVDKLFRGSKLYRAKWERDDYRNSTLDMACATTLNNASQIQVSKPQKEELNIALLEAWLLENNISIKSNEITHELEVSGFDEAYNPQTIVEQMHIILYDALKPQFKCNNGLIQNYLSVIAQKNRYNPVLEMLHNADAWDGKDRIEELYRIIRIDEKDTLSKTLVHKWLLMAVAMAQNNFNSPYGADGILVFQGPQGIGKTSLCTKLGVSPKLTKTGLYIDSNDKDTVIRSTSCWIGELGELETTLRSDMARLKSFITADIDRYRAPYGRTEVYYPRRTCFIATCNTREFLADESGSRRFWVVPCKEKFDLKLLNDFNALQLWKQIESELNQYPYSKDNYSPYQSCFRLTDKERTLLAERNSVFNRQVKAQVEIEDILAMAENAPELYEYKWCTATQFKSAYPTLNKYSSENIGRALSAIGVEEKSLRINNAKSVSKGCRNLPFSIQDTSINIFKETIQVIEDTSSENYGEEIF